METCRVFLPMKFLSSEPGHPLNLMALDVLSILENQPVGTIVGAFNVTDPGWRLSLPTTW